MPLSSSSFGSPWVAIIVPSVVLMMCPKDPQPARSNASTIAAIRVEKRVIWFPFVI
jgi:hypothetical protein